MVIPLRDFIALTGYLHLSSLWVPWGFEVLLCFNWYLVILQTSESYRLLEHIWNKWVFLIWLGHVLSWTFWSTNTCCCVRQPTLFFVALLLCFVFFVAPVSNLQLILCVCAVGVCSTSPLVPVLQTEPAGQLLLEPTLQLQPVSARVPPPGALLGGSPWRENSVLLHFLHGTAYTSVMWHLLWNWLLMEGCGGTATRPRKGSLETWSKTITFPLRAAVTRHILWTVWSRCVKVFHSQQNGGWLFCERSCSTATEDVSMGSH